MNFIADNGILILMFEIYLIVLMCCYYNHVYNGGGFSTIGLSAIIGGAISLFIVNIFKFEDATSETVITICMGIMILPILFTFEAMSYSKMKQQQNQIKNEIQKKQLELKEIQLKTENNLKIVSLIQLLSFCGGDVENLESNEKVRIQKFLSTSEYNLRKEINELSSKIKI